MKKIFTLFALVIGCCINNINSCAQPGILDQTFNPGTGGNNSVYRCAIQSDGKIIIGGGFTSFNGTTMNRIARLNDDGSLDSSFHIGIGFNSFVKSLAIQSDGKIIVGGNFSSFNGSSCGQFIRLNTNGSRDTSFNTGAGFAGFVNSIVIQSDGKIVVGGLFNYFNGATANYIARLNINGSLDTSFAPSGTGFNSEIFSIAIQSDGKIIAGGFFTWYNGISRNRIARLNTDGSLDTSFNPGLGFSNTVYSIVLQNDGKIIAGGAFLDFNGTLSGGIARLNTDGSYDNSFFYTWVGFDIDRFVGGIAIQSDGKIIAGGGFTTFNGITINRIARLNLNGSLDNSFNPGSGPNSNILSVALQSDGKIIAVGEFNSISGVGRNGIARLLNCQTTSIINAIGCNSHTENGQTYTSSGTFTQVMPNANITGCDSIITINLTINESTTSTVNPVACYSYTENGQTFTSSGSYMQVISNTAGCDSTITINLTINNGTDSTIAPVTCYSHTENGQTFTSSGIFTQVITNAVGCDSTITIILTINNTDSTINYVGCDSYTENNQTYTASGTYVQIIPNAAGCDSIITINLTLGSISTINPIACDSYTENNQTYTSSGNYTQVIPNSTGCDSTITINLTINESTTSAINPIACNSHTVNSQTYTSSGTYIQVVQNTVGCDSTITINLIIDTVITGLSENNNVLIADLSGATYQWIDCNNSNQPIANETNQTFTPTMNGNYAVIVTENNCTDTSSCMAFTTIGIEENNLNNLINIYPNPNTGNFIIETSTSTSIEIFNTLGQMILRKSLSPGINNIGLEKAGSGMYFISSVDGKGNRVTQRVVVVK